MIDNYTWPVEKAGNFPFQKGKKEILKNFRKYKSIVSLSLISLNINQNLYLIQHNPSFTLFLICFYFLSELRCSYKVCSYQKRVYNNSIKRNLSICVSLKD